MVLQSSLPTSNESTPFCASNSGKDYQFCDYMLGTEIWLMFQNVTNNPTNAVKKLLHSLSKKRVTRSSHTPTISKMSESSALYIVEGSCKETLLTFYQQSQREAERIVLLLSILMVPAVAKKSGEDFLSVMSYDGPSAVRKKQSLMSLHEHGAFHMPPPPQKEAARKLLTFLSAQAPVITKRRRGDFLLVVSSDGHSLSVEEALEVSQDKHECKAGRAVPRPPLASSGEPQVSNQNLEVDVLLLKTFVLIKIQEQQAKNLCG
ncbi:hypothetical protein OIU74_029645 [Salix koriyanagi]|uniref:Uncharacterized protein n=1 Tax=Salix koriyanagi TaxID=2511006 RepID=A0A9Q0VEF7_9ROSI|nr:hypothetical protein OIU74_029645 [Salix koriyanagi]